MSEHCICEHVVCLKGDKDFMGGSEKGVHWDHSSLVKCFRRPEGLGPVLYLAALFY